MTTQYTYFKIISGETQINPLKKYYISWYYLFKGNKRNPQCWYDEIAGLPAILFHLEQLPLPLERSKR
jgi:hypothetical protein